MQPERKAADPEKLRVVSEDLTYLFSDWNQDIDDSSLRRDSAVLRRLLVDGDLSSVARSLGRELRIMAPAIGRTISDNQLRQYAFFTVGGAKYRGMEVQAMSLIGRALTEREIKENLKSQKTSIGRSYPVKLSVYLRQTSIVVEGTLINREEVIKYVANKLGGSHYDPERAPDTGSSTLDAKYRLLDKIRAGYKTADKNSVYYELLSIGQRVVNSRDVRQLRKQLSQLVRRPDVIRVPPTR